MKIFSLHILFTKNVEILTFPLKISVRGSTAPINKTLFRDFSGFILPIYTIIMSFRYNIMTIQSKV